VIAFVIRRLLAAVPLLLAASIICFVVILVLLLLEGAGGVAGRRHQGRYFLCGREVSWGVQPGDFTAEPHDAHRGVSAKSQQTEEGAEKHANIQKYSGVRDVFEVKYEFASNAV